MQVIYAYASVVLLFMLIVIPLFVVLREAVLFRQRKAELHRFQSGGGQADAISEEAGISPPRMAVRRLQVMLDAAGIRFSVHHFIGLSSVMTLLGATAGLLLFQHVKGFVLCAVILGGAPFLYAKLKQISFQSKSRIDFLPAVEVFYQYYVLSESGNVRSVMRDALKEDRMPYPVRLAFEKLEMMLAVHRHDEALDLFRLTLGHIWADYFISILRIALSEGSNIAEGLKELIGDMRQARRAAQADRNRLLEIRIANFTPLGFLALFMAVNFKLGPSQAYQYYFMDPAGKSLLLDALALIFLSMFMGVYLSMKRM